MDRGFTRVHPLRGGLDAWMEAGYGIEDETIVTLRRQG
jgi:rhodanese-related sulfurtransferase